MKNDPKDIYQRHLDICTQAYLDEDYPTLLHHLSVPAYMSSSDIERWVATSEELEDCLRTARNSLRNMGADDYVRICREASFAGPENARVVGEHDTFILRNGQSVIPRYRSVMTLVLEDGHWSARGIASDVNSLDYSLFSTRMMQQFTEEPTIPPKRSARKA